jgi:hypothetical protein
MNQIQSLDLATIGDIYSGKIYQNHIDHGRLGKIHQLSYSLAIDGVRWVVCSCLITSQRKSKKGNTSYWPIWLVANELAPEIRFKKDYVRLLGIWFGKTKPQMNSFLKPMTQMFIKAWHKGNFSFVLTHNTVGITVKTTEGQEFSSTALLLPCKILYCYLITKVFWI